MVVFLKDPTGAPLWEENPEAKDVVHIETERVSISFSPDEDQLSILGVHLVWELHAEQKQWVRQSTRSTRLFCCLQRPHLALIKGQEHLGAYGAYKIKPQIADLPRIFWSWQQNLWRRCLIEKRVKFFYIWTQTYLESFPAERATLNQKVVLLMEMRWLCNSSEERIDCFRGVYARWLITSFGVSTAKSQSSAAGSNLVMKQEYKQSWWMIFPWELVNPSMHAI